MKRILAAMLLLCLLVPACAMAEEVTVRFLTHDGLVHREDNCSIGDPYSIGYAPDLFYVQGMLFDNRWMDVDTGEIFHHGEEITPTVDLTLKPVFVPAVTMTRLAKDGSVIDTMHFPKDSIQWALPYSVAEGSEQAPQRLITQWLEPESGITIREGECFYADRDLTLIAQNEVKPVIIQYETGCDGGSEPQWDMMAVPPGEPAYVRPYTFRKNDSSNEYFFMGWTETQGSGVVVYTPDKPFPATKDMKLYGVWKNAGTTEAALRITRRGVDGKEMHDPSLPSRLSIPTNTYIDLIVISGMPHEEGYEIRVELDGEKKEPPYILRPAKAEHRLTFYYEKLSPIRFVRAAASLPETGDASMLGAWMCLLGASAAAMGLRRKK